MLRVIFAGLKYGYGRPELGLSADLYYFYSSLQRMEGIEVSFFPVDERMHSVGRDAMNAELLRTVQASAPDLLFCCLYTEEIKRDTIAYITRHTDTKTLNWFCDDSWRFWTFSRYWAPLFTAVVTTDSQAMAKYERLGIRNVIKSQWAANPYIYFPQTPRNESDKYGISFVGQKHSNRNCYISALQCHNLPISAYGSGFPSGMIPFERMLQVFSWSRINLNFCHSSGFGSRQVWKQAAKLLLKRELGRYKFSGHHICDNFRAMIGHLRPQMKARIFEIPACGGFQMSTDADNLRDYYMPGKEIVLFESIEDLVEKSRYYLKNEDEREANAEAGYRRTIAEHTYAHRFEEIFRQMELVGRSGSA